jgi:transcriptional regulator with XRE-family HTH domain
MSEEDRELLALGRTIRQLRETRGMTTAELACAAGVEREQLEALEAGRSTPADEGLDSDVDTTSAACAAFGRRLRDLREQRDLSQDALARLTGINRTSIWTCEHGGSNPKLTTIERLARGLAVPPRKLIEDGE